jgi:hypothetical protein
MDSITLDVALSNIDDIWDAPISQLDGIESKPRYSEFPHTNPTQMKKG